MIYNQTTFQETNKDPRAKCGPSLVLALGAGQLPPGTKRWFNRSIGFFSVQQCLTSNWQSNILKARQLKTKTLQSATPILTSSAPGSRRDNFNIGIGVVVGVRGPGIEGWLRDASPTHHMTLIFASIECFWDAPAFCGNKLWTTSGVHPAYLLSLKLAPELGPVCSALSHCLVMSWYVRSSNLPLAVLV